MKLSIKQAAIEFGVSRETVTRSLKANGTPTAKEYTLAQIYKALTGDHKKQRTRSETARADLLEMTLARKRGDSVDCAKMWRIVSAAFLPVRQRILSLPSIANLANPGDASQARRALLGWVDETLPILRAEIGKIPE